MPSLILGDNSPASATAGYDYRLFDVASIDLFMANAFEVIDVN